RARYFSTRSCDVTVPIRCAASSWRMLFSVTSKLDAGAGAGSGAIWPTCGACATSAAAAKRIARSVLTTEPPEVIDATVRSSATHDCSAGQRRADGDAHLAGRHGATILDMSPE